MKMLIIEDDILQSLNLKLHLNDLGYNNVVIANSLISVQEMTESERYDVIFCDIRMPDADGVALLSTYLTSQLNSAVIIASGVDDNVQKLTKGMCNQLGYSYVGILKKPFSRQDLDMELKRFLEHKYKEKCTAPIMS
ncbi:response regulator [Vibrio alfacsensis]|uniref:Response regulator n=1 Tax=Vibrio alfacsensis TaxID=1074311 RepID=A0ABM6YS33_9VIBR|nr:response regulator [Vibrio alfacsensis]AXY00473.1 response regulator [Vibrio alfacsensis]